MSLRDRLMPPKQRIVDQTVALQRGEAAVFASVTLGEEHVRLLREQGFECEVGQVVELGQVSAPVRLTDEQIRELRGGE